MRAGNESISKEATERREEDAAIQKDLEEVEAKLKQLRKRIKRAGTIKQIEFSCTQVEVFHHSKHRVKVIAMLGGN